MQRSGDDRGCRCRGVAGLSYAVYESRRFQNDSPQDVQQAVCFLEDRLEADESLREVARALTEAGVKTAGGGKWSAAAVRAVAIRWRGVKN